MKLAVSNIALPSFSHVRELAHLNSLGVSGLEVAPSKVWAKVAEVSPAEVQAYRKTVEDSGLQIIGLHSLFYDQPNLGIFQDSQTVAKTLTFMVHLSQICADLGGKTLVFGSGSARRKEALTNEEADNRAIDFFNTLVERTQGHGTVILIEPLSTEYADYLATLEHAKRIVTAIDSPALGCHIDIAAACAANELDIESFTRIAPHLFHVHVNEPGLGPLTRGGSIDHHDVAQLLKQIDYAGFISLEQRLMDATDIIGPVASSVQIIKECYL